MKRLPWVAVGSLFIFSACATLEVGQKAPQKTPELLNIGKKLYQENCVQCHGIEGDGKGPA
jgi:mono/diheme cytochrome c family protein